MKVYHQDLEEIHSWINPGMREFGWTQKHTDDGLDVFDCYWIDGGGNRKELTKDSVGYQDVTLDSANPLTRYLACEEPKIDVRQELKIVVKQNSISINGCILWDKSKGNENG